MQGNGGGPEKFGATGAVLGVIPTPFPVTGIVAAFCEFGIPLLSFQRPIVDSMNMDAIHVDRIHGSRSLNICVFFLETCC